MTVLNDKISKYVQLSKEISRLKKDLSNKKQEIERKNAIAYGNLKRTLTEYISKIKSTVEIVCNLYKTTVTLSNNKILLSGELLLSEFTPVSACDVAIKAGNESLKYLSAVIKKINPSQNLAEFTVRYNTVIDIFSRVESLKEQAISIEVYNYGEKINSLEKELNNLCKTKEERDLLLLEMKKSSESIFNKVMLQDEKPMQKEFLTEVSIPLGYQSYGTEGILPSVGDKLFTSLLCWDLHKNGVLAVMADNKDIDSPALSRFIQNTVTQFLFAYPLYSKKILLCDSRYSSQITAFAGILQNENNNLFFGSASDGYVKNTEEGIKNALLELNRIINKRIATLAQSSCKDLLEYNNKNQNNPESLILVVLNGYPFKYEYASDDIVSLLKNGKKAGVYALFVENTYTDEESKFVRNRLPDLNGVKNLLSFKEKNKDYCLLNDGEEFYIDTCGSNYDIRKLLCVFKETKEKVDKKIVYLDSVLEKENFEQSKRRKEYSRVLSIPIGKQGSNTVNVGLDASNSNAHLALIGTTGTGKTAFLNTLVLSACSLYSPKELELHMILMAKSSFLIFKEQNLPHLKTLVTGDKISRANDVLDFIQDEFNRRSRLIGSSDDIYTYNAKAENPLSRCVIVIDEFYELVKDNQDAIERIAEFARTGRGVGISLVISSIVFPTEVSKIIAEFGNRVEFKAQENAGQLIPQVANRQSELEQGRCFFERDNNLRFITVAYSGEKELLTSHIKNICEKYPSSKMSLKNVVTTVRVAKEEDAPYFHKTSQDANYSLQMARGAYENEGRIRVRLGKTDLTNLSLEYTFKRENNVLFLFGEYLATKTMEASLIKDTLVLSNKIEEPTVYYIDYNQDVLLGIKDTVIKRVAKHWDAKIVRGLDSDVENLFDDISDLIERRRKREVSLLYPVLVLISQADDLIARDEDLCERLYDLISRGKNALVFFAIQCDKPVKACCYEFEKYYNDAIIFPNNSDEYDSDSANGELCEALDALPAVQSEDGKKLFAKIAKFGLDPKLHILCNNNKVNLFVPYEYDEEYLKNIVEKI